MKISTRTMDGTGTDQNAVGESQYFQKKNHEGRGKAWSLKSGWRQRKKKGTQVKPKKKPATMLEGKERALPEN